MLNIVFDKYDNDVLELQHSNGIFFIDVTESPDVETVNKDNLVKDRYKISPVDYLIKDDLLINMARCVAEDQRLNVMYFRHNNVNIYVVPVDTNIDIKRC
jgi:hypothetical protein